MPKAIGMTNFEKLKRDLTFAQLCEFITRPPCEACPARGSSCPPGSSGSCIQALTHWGSSEYDELGAEGEVVA